MENLNPGYFAVIPAEIRYDRSLNPLEKLLYAEITALTNKEGCCWANNSYFANLFNRRSDYISKVINKLATKGYVKIDLITTEKGVRRNIFIGNVEKKRVSVTIKSNTKNNDGNDKNSDKQANGSSEKSRYSKKSLGGLVKNHETLYNSMNKKNEYKEKIYKKEKFLKNFLNKTQLNKLNLLKQELELLKQSKPAEYRNLNTLEKLKRWWDDEDYDDEEWNNWIDKKRLSRQMIEIAYEKLVNYCLRKGKTYDNYKEALKLFALNEKNGIFANNNNKQT
jgi:hypothetical protein